jgi:hypothetical protein
MVQPKDDTEVLQFFWILVLTWGHEVALFRLCAASWKVMGLFPDDDIGMFH